MSDASTFMGGPDPTFRTTVWSDVLAARDPSHPLCREKLAQLLQAYWRPVYAYIRAAWHKPVEDAKDLTQGFFARFIEKDYLSNLRGDGGSFRAYLRKALQHFLINREEAEAVRHAHGRLFSLDAAADEFEQLGAAAPNETPERAYDREWFRCLIQASIQDLRATLEREGKSGYFDAFRAYCIEPCAGPALPKASTLLDEKSECLPTYREVADRLGVKESDVRNHLSYCRRLLWEIVRARIRNYVAAEDDIERELREAAGG